ncbi:MAG: hypothetical protein ACLUAR_21005 [Pilosibacter sp.]
MRGTVVPDEAVDKFREGMTLADGLSCMPAELEILEQKSGGSGRRGQRRRVSCGSRFTREIPSG